MNRSFPFLMLASLALQGCMFSPGQYLSTSDITRQGASESSRVELIPITPKLIAMDRATQKRTSLPAELLATPAEYRIGSNDVLYITVWDHPELTAPSGAQQQIDANGRLVRSDGTLYYPLSRKSRRPAKPSSNCVRTSPNGCQPSLPTRKWMSPCCALPARK